MTETVIEKPVARRVVAEPLYDRIIVQRDAAAVQTAGGLHLPEQAQEKPKMGTVLAVGEGYIDEHGTVRALRLKAGDRVLFSPYVGTELEIDGFASKLVVILRECDVMARITEAPDGDLRQG